MLKNTMSPEEKTMANVQAKHPENLQSTFLITQYKLFISTIVSTNFEKEKLHIHRYHFVFCFTACEINFIPHIKEFQKAQTVSQCTAIVQTVAKTLHNKSVWPCSSKSTQTITS